LAASVSLDAGDFSVIEASWESLPFAQRQLLAFCASQDAAGLRGFLSSLSEEDSLDLVNSEDQDDDTPLHYCAYRGYIDVASVLIEFGARLNEYGCSARTPIVAAACEGQVAFVHTLVEHHGASLLLDDSLDENIVHKIVSRGSLDLLRVFMRHRQMRYLVNHRNVLGSTPLHSAADFCQYEAAQLLLDAGSDPSIVDYFGYKPKDVAEYRGHAELSVFLEQCETPTLAV
jgi:ankyrin repeat protein